MERTVRPSRPVRVAGLFFTLAILAVSGLLFEGAFTDEDMIGEADGIRNVEGYITMKSSGSNQQGNLVKLYTGPGESRFTDQMFGEVEIYRTSKVLRDRIFVNMSMEFDDPSLVRGSVNPQVFTIDPGGKFARQAISVQITLASPMLQYSTGLGGLVRVKVWGTWMSQWNAGTGGEWQMGVIEPYYIYVQIVPYHYLQMSFDPAMVDLSPGGTGEIDVIVMNTANGLERVELTIPNEQVFAKEGWIFEFNRTTMDIGPKSEARARIRITAPRSSIRWNMDTKDFTVIATSYYDNFAASSEGREPFSYEMTFMVYIFGLDFAFVPWAWAVVLWVIIALVLFNLGINPLVMRRRRLPPGKEPGFKALRRFASDPQKRDRVRAGRIARKEARAAERDSRKAEKKRIREEESRNKEPPKKKARVMDLKVKEDDFELPEISRDATPLNASRSASVDDDFEIPDLKVEKERKPLFSMTKKPGKKEAEAIALPRPEKKEGKRGLFRRPSTAPDRSEDEIRDIEL